MELANYAITPQKSRGRLYPDFTNVIRSPFQRDRDRLIHSSAFRRLDGKTQVFAYHEGKNYRTRLTHSIEVAQITRTICKCLGLNEELGEAIALAHDLGHSPFGHAGERALQNSMKKFGGFDHNIQSLKIMTKLEIHYPEFEGLNLTWETLEGTVKHNGPIKKVSNKYLKEYNKKFNLDLANYPSLEGQVGAVADDIAYNNHDIDDGFRAGFFSIEKLRELPFIDEILVEFDKQNPYADDNLKIYAITRNTIAKMIFDVLKNSKDNIQKYNISDCDDARKQKKFMIDFSDEMKNNIKLLRQFLKEEGEDNQSRILSELAQPIDSYLHLIHLVVFPGKSSIVETIVAFIKANVSEGRNEMVKEWSFWVINELRAKNAVYVSNCLASSLQVLVELHDHSVICVE